jgi:hypothetical protein
MQALTLPARRGWYWFYDGYRIFRKNRLMLALIVLCYWLMMIVVNSVPVIGQIAVTVLIPIFSVSLMNVCRLVENGGRVIPQLLFSGFNKHLRELVVLGAAYLVAALAILGASALFDDGALFQMFTIGRQPDLTNGSVLVAAEIALIAFAPLMMAYWYAPVLVAWHDLPPGKSLFFSFVACARNWRPFLTYSLAVVLAFALVPAFVRGVFAALVPGAMGFFTTVLTMVVVLILAPTLYASFYVSYRDVFVESEGDA